MLQRHGGADERLEGLFIDLAALRKIDGAPHVAFETGVEEVFAGSSSAAPLAKVVFTAVL